MIEEWLLKKGTPTVGHFATSHQAVVAAVRVIGSLVRIPKALTRVADAGSTPVAELLGRRLVDG